MAENGQRFAVGDVVHFTEDARSRTTWHGRRKGWRVPKGDFTVERYTGFGGDLKLSNGSVWSESWLEPACGNALTEEEK